MLLLTARHRSRIIVKYICLAPRVRHLAYSYSHQFCVQFATPYLWNRDPPNKSHHCFIFTSSIVADRSFTSLAVMPVTTISCTSTPSPCCCCLPTPMTLVSGGGSPIYPHVFHRPASPSNSPAMYSLRQGQSTNLGVTMWCVPGCS